MRRRIAFRAAAVAAVIAAAVGFAAASASAATAVEYGLHAVSPAATMVEY